MISSDPTAWGEQSANPLDNQAQLLRADGKLSQKTQGSHWELQTWDQSTGWWIIGEVYTEKNQISKDLHWDLELSTVVIPAIQE